MISCAADEIMMGKHSSLGPTDPQVMLVTPLGTSYIPAQAVLDQFDKAQRECSDPAKLSAWLPMLSQYGPVRAGSACAMRNGPRIVQGAVSTWLEAYMFRHRDDRAKFACDISDWLSDHQRFKSHGRHLSRSELSERGLSVLSLEDDEKLQDLGLSVFHATTHTFAATPAVKIVENHAGRAFIKRHLVAPQAQAVQIALDPTPPAD